MVNLTRISHTVPIQCSFPQLTNSYTTPTNPDCFTIKDDWLLLRYSPSSIVLSTMHVRPNLDCSTFAILQWLLHNSNMVATSICCNLIGQSMVF